MPTYSNLNLFGKVAGPLIIACMCIGLLMSFLYSTSDTVEQHEGPYICTPHRYERGECIPEIKPGDTTRYCPKSLCGESKWYPND